MLEYNNASLLFLSQRWQQSIMSYKPCKCLLNKHLFVVQQEVLGCTVICKFVFGYSRLYDVAIARSH